MIPTLLVILAQAAAAQTVTLTTESTAEYFEPVTGWVSSLDAAEGLQAFVYLRESSGAFRVRLGVQTANDPSVPMTPTSIGSQSGTLSSVGVANGLFYRFNPNAANDGNVDSYPMFRVGLLYSLNVAGSGSGVVQVNRLTWR